MKESLKKYWTSLAIIAFVVALCLGFGIFMLASPSAQTQLNNEVDSPSQTEEVTEEISGELLLISEDGLSSNGGTAQAG